MQTPTPERTVAPTAFPPSSASFNNARLRDFAGWFRDNLPALALSYLEHTDAELYEKLPPAEPAIDFGCYCELVRSAEAARIGVALPPRAG